MKQGLFLLFHPCSTFRCDVGFIGDNHVCYGNETLLKQL